MQRALKIFQILTLISFFIIACNPVMITPSLTVESIISTDTTPTLTITRTITPPLPAATDLPSATPESTIQINEYGNCGSGELIQVPYFFTDVNGTISPTQFIRTHWTDDSVRYSVKLTTCLKYDEGWKSNPEKVDSGYENVIIFFDKYGKGHEYPIIIGGHYINPYNPNHRDITASMDGIDTHFYRIDDWIKKTQAYFQTTGVRQVGVNIYIEDTQGNQSSVLKQVYQFREFNKQIEDALKTGEGYPDKVPEDFFIFATESWLIKAD